MGVASRARWRHQGTPRGGRWENKRQQHNETAEGNATDAQTEDINLRPTPCGGGTEETVPQVKKVGFAAY